MLGRPLKLQPGMSTIGDPVLARSFRFCCLASQGNGVVKTTSHGQFMEAGRLNVLARKSRRCKLTLHCKKNDQEPSETSEEAGGPDSLRALDAYFLKLQGNGARKSSSNGSARESSSSEPRDLQGLNALNAYFDRMEDPAKRDAAKDEQVLSFLKELETTLTEENQNENVEVNLLDVLKVGPRNASYLPNIFVGLNVAVFLFGLASPVQTPEMVEVSLPVLFGAKSNQLIVDGQWWRLITSSFLHDGLIHIGLGTWALLSFGPVVEYVYGSTGFCMIYLLGGAFGNLISCFHTPAPTVGGTGPLYALVAAWAMYVLQNRTFFSKELQLVVTADLIQKVLVMCALHFAFADALPADNWTHLGATFVGVIFGLIAAPKVEMNVQLEDSNNRMSLPGQAPELQRLVLAFATCLTILVCLYAFGIPAANELIAAVSEPSEVIQSEMLR